MFKKSLALFYIVLFLFSGPLYTGTVYALENADFNLSLDWVTQPLEVENDTILEPIEDEIPIQLEPTITTSISCTSGATPLFVTFTGFAEIPDGHPGVLVYKWDFDGDGVNDYANLNSANITHVYETKTATKISAVLTILYEDGSEDKETFTIAVDPTRDGDWLEIRDLGVVKFGFRSNGTIIIYDDTNWLPLTFLKDAKSLNTPTLKSVDNSTSRLTYASGDTLLDVTLTYGATGRATFNITEYLPEGVADKSLLGKIEMPVQQAKGDLGFVYTDSPEAEKDETGVVPVRYYSSVKSGSGDVWGTGGAVYSPWRDQGITPYGEYFKSLSEYVATQTGYLTITQTDLSTSGRGLDLIFKRVYSPPSTYEDDLPASSTDYSYQSYPWIPMGNGWELGLPWIEYSGTTIKYIHLGNGQRYEYTSAGTTGTKYASGDYFKFYKHSNNTYTIYTVDGTRYDFDSSFKPSFIEDTDGNSITFSYTSNKITTITDSIGRTLTLSYNGDGLLSGIASGSRTVSYAYEDGVVSGHRLVSVTDPDDRITEYHYYKDYLISSVEYPTGGCSTYEYSYYEHSGYSRYRVSSNTKYDGSELSSLKTYSYGADYDVVTNVTIREGGDGGVSKATFLDYSTSSLVIEKVWDGDVDSTLVYETRQYIDSTRRRQTTERYLGDSSSHNDTVKRWDEWGNVVYMMDYGGHVVYGSYVNTDYDGKFVNSAGTQITLFSDSFFDVSVNSQVHDLLLGQAELQDGTGSPPIEAYYDYAAEGHAVESKQLLDGAWIIREREYDSYGNVVESTDANGNTVFYEYNATYSGAYLTNTTRVLEGIVDESLTTLYGYDYDTGLLIRQVDESGNVTTYDYDVLGRVTEVEYPQTGLTVPEKTAVYCDEGYGSESFEPETAVNLSDGNSVLWSNSNTFRAAGLWWLYYFNDTSDSLYYVTSGDGVDWSIPIKIGDIYSYNYNWDVEYDGFYFHFVRIYRLSPTNYIYYRRGIPQANGTITWSTDNWQTVSSYSRLYHKCTLCIDSNNGVWLAYGVSNSDADPVIHVKKNDAIDGTWSSSTDEEIDTCDTTRFSLKLVPLTDGKICLLYAQDYWVFSIIYNGSWVNKRSIDVLEDYPIDAVAYNDDIYITYTKEESCVKFRKYTYSTTYWGNAVDVCSERPVKLASTVNGQIYAIYVNGTDINYRIYNGSSFSAESTLIAGDSPTSVEALTTEPYFVCDKLSIVYQKGSSPYSIRHYILSLSDYGFSNVTITDENGNQVVNHYDGLGRLVVFERYNNTGVYSNETYTYNCLGLTESKTTAEGNTYSYIYSGLGESITTVNPDGTFTETVYNYTANTQDVYDEEGRRKTLFNDLMGRLVEVREYNTTTSYYLTEYTYDEVGNLVKVVDAEDHETEYSYDQLGRLRFTTYPDLTTDERRYDDAGNLVYVRSRSYNYTEYEYDSLNRLVDTRFYDYAAWYSKWEYRKAITITGSTAGEQTDYPVKIRVYYGSGTDNPPDMYCNSSCQSDFDDIRFTADDGVTMLDYFKGRTVNSSYADFWVKVPKIVASPGVTKIYAYYGNLGVPTTSNGTATFTQFDDFETVYYKGYGEYWDFTFDDNTVKLSDDNSYVNNYSMYLEDTSASKETCAEWDVPDLTSGGYRVYYAFTHSSYGSQQMYSYLYGQNGYIAISLLGGTLHFYTPTGNIPVNYTLDEWHSLELQFSLPAYTANLVLDDVEYSDLDVYDVFTSIRYLWISDSQDRYTNKFWVDSAFIAKYVDPEPTVSGFGDVEAMPSIDGWGSRKEITITGSTAGAQTEYPIKLRVYYGSGVDSTSAIYCGSGCQADFSDLRFTDSNGELLDYWIESTEERNYADVWVEVSSIPASPGTATIYVYYGKSHVSPMSSGSETFLFFDDFEGSMLSDELWDFNVTGHIHYSINDGKMRVTDAARDSDGTDYWIVNNQDYGSQHQVKWTPVNGFAIHWKQEAGDTSSSERGQAGFGIVGSDDLLSAYTGQYDGTSSVALYRKGAYTFVESTTTGSASVTPPDTRIYEIRRVGTNISIYDVTAGAETVSGTSNDVSKVALATGTWSDKVFIDYFDFDYVTIRAYVYPEPVITSVGALEELPGDEASLFNSYTYDVRGNRLTSTHNGTTVSYTYDARSRMTSETFNITGAAYTVGYVYDDVGNVIQTIYPDGYRLNSTYDDLNRLTSLGGYAGYTYTLDDQYDAITFGNNVTQEFTYDTRSRPVNILVSYGGTTYLNNTYTYDSSGSITEIVNGTVTETYSYDELDRLIGTTGPWGSISYTYDSVGNMLTKGATTYTYDEMNRLTKVGTSDDYAYDSNGNLVGREDGSTSWVYQYDGLNQLVSASRNGTVVRRYAYDAGGRRVRSYAGSSGNNVYIYSGLSAVYEVPEGGSATLRFYAGGKQVAERTGLTVTYFHLDHLGSTRLKTDSIGDMVFSSNYQPFGVESGLSGSEEFRYTGKPSDDETELVYFGARWYLPEVGRFITEDPHPSSIFNPQSLNRYVYCRNNPHKYIDLTGLSAQQLGVDFNILIPLWPVPGIFGFGINVHATFGIASSDSSYGKQMGFFVTPGIGIGFGTLTGSASVAITTTENAEKVEDLEGDSLDLSLGGTATPIHIEGSASIPITDNGLDLDPDSWSLTTPLQEPFGVGYGVSGSAQVSHTATLTYSDNPYDSRWWMEDKYYGQTTQDSNTPPNGLE